MKTQEQIDALVLGNVFNTTVATDGVVPAYSTDFKHAWTVLEEMEKKGFMHSIGNKKASDSEWKITFYNEQKRHQAAHKEAAMAVCLAALSALGVSAE